MRGELEIARRRLRPSRGASRASATPPATSLAGQLWASSPGRAGALQRAGQESSPRLSAVAVSAQIAQRVGGPALALGQWAWRVALSSGVPVRAQSRHAWIVAAYAFGCA